MLFAVLTTTILGLADALPSPTNGPTPAVSCTSYTPIGWSSGNAKINYYNNNPNSNPANGAGLQAPTLPANTTFSLTGRFRLAKGNKGFPFTFAACNVNSLGLTTNTTQSSCSHSGCYISYTNYVQVHDPAGRCLTVTTYDTSTSGLSFRQCDPNPHTKAQYFQTTQQVLYSPGYFSLQSYGTVQFDLVQNFDHEDPSLGGSARAWFLSREDNRTIESVHAQYTQVGLSAMLLQA